MLALGRPAGLELLELDGGELCKIDASTVSLKPASDALLFVRLCFASSSSAELSTELDTKLSLRTPPIKPLPLSFSPPFSFSFSSFAFSSSSLPLESDLLILFVIPSFFFSPSTTHPPLSFSTSASTPLAVPLPTPGAHSPLSSQLSSLADRWGPVLPYDACLDPPTMMARGCEFRCIDLGRGAIELG